MTRENGSMHKDVRNPAKSAFEPISFSFSAEKYANMHALSNAIAHQIWCEQQLVSTRMRWNFAVQGFLIAVIVYSETAYTGWSRFFVQIFLTIAGFVVGLFVLWAIQAAQLQSTRLRSHWVNTFAKPLKGHSAAASELDPLDCDIVEGGFVQPFSPREGSARGRYASVRICHLLLGFWILVFIATCIKFGLENHASLAA